MKPKGWLTKGKLRTYDVRFKHNWFEVYVRVYEICPRRWLPGYRWKRVAEYVSNNRPRLPSHYQSLAVWAVERYETWKLEWENHELKEAWDEVVVANEGKNDE